MIGQQVDLIDVQQAAVGARQQAGLEVAFAGLQGTLQVERAEDAVLRAPMGNSTKAAAR